MRLAEASIISPVTNYHLIVRHYRNLARTCSAVAAVHAVWMRNRHTTLGATVDSLPSIYTIYKRNVVQGYGKNCREQESNGIDFPVQFGGQREHLRKTPFAQSP